MTRMRPVPPRQTKHEFLRRLERLYSTGLSRQCGWPPCRVIMKVDLLLPETNFKGRAFCSTDHQRLAVDRRKKLLKTIAEIDMYLADESLRPTAPHGYPDLGLATVKLERWRTRLQWELDGM